MTIRRHPMPFGAELGADGVRFRLWAPDAQAVSLIVERSGQAREIPLVKDEGGWCEAFVTGVDAGARYRYRINNDLEVPDPASRYQPDDVHGASEVIDPCAYAWSDSGWHGRPWEEVVLYELHVGTFTPQGTFGGVSERLDHLVNLGVTAIELMPVADFPGNWDWGYDGVCLYAPDASYGRPEDLKALIDAAHARGLMVFLDVVYNHFGPEGNYLHVYAKRFFNFDRHTPWGAAINFDGIGKEVVRNFFIQNALFWIEEYHVDGLRFDAVHAIEDHSSPDVLEELATTVRATVDANRHVHLVLENDNNQARYLKRNNDRTPRYYVAQWNDDIHHAFHVLITGEEKGYYVDYVDAARHLGRCLTEGYAYQGDESVFRRGERRGEPSARLPLTAFVSFLQNHDQIGNRAFGERISALAQPEALRAAVALMLLAPPPPLLFMGEEWAASQPFQFFCDLGEHLKDPVREGRRKEFASFPEFQDPAARAQIPDPSEPATFLRCKLDWTQLDIAPHREMLSFYRQLLELRSQEISPRLAGIQGHSGAVRWQNRRALMVEWRLGDGSLLSVAANMAPTPSESPNDTWGRPVIYATPGAGRDPHSGLLPPWSVAWFLQRA